MLTHRKNWCRVCGTCLTCPRTRQSQFQRGTCKCEERQASHVPPKRVKSESLLSFRYRHLSAEDIDILEEIRPRFQFPTLPIERALVRANICSTCQQRLRRARLARCRQARPARPKDSTQAPAESSAASDSDKSVGALLSSTFCAADDAPQNNTPSYSRFGGIGASADAAFQAHRSELRSTFTTSAYQPSAMQLIEKRGGAEQRIAADKAQIDSTAMSAADNTQGSLDWKLRSAAFGGAEMEAAAAPRFQHQCQQQCHFPVVQPLRPHPEPQPREQAGTAPSAFERSDLYEASVEELDATHVDLEESGQMVGDWHRLLPVPNSGSASGYEGMLYDHNASLSTPLFAQRAPPNVEFRDASNSVLFRESLSHDYALEDVFYQYYPNAPRALLFYAQGNIALPKRITLEELFARCPVRQLPVVIWVKMPITENPAHQPQWKLVP